MTSRVLVLNRFGLESMHYAEWLGSDTVVTLVTDASCVNEGFNEASYEKVIQFDDYSQNPLVEFTAQQLHEQKAFDAVIAMSEFDLIRAGRLVDRFGIDGQSLDSARAFRDKLEMKRTLSAEDIPIAAFAPVFAAMDLLDFIDRQGYPIIVKPRRGAATRGVVKLSDEAQLWDYVQGHEDFRSDRPSDLMVEKFIESELIHVDGALFEGHPVAIWPSHGAHGLTHLKRGSHRSIMYEVDEPGFDEVIALVQAALLALPTPRVALFHAEVFRSLDGSLLINEIASRMGGARIKTMWQGAFDVNLEEWFVRHVLSSQLDEVRFDFTVPRVGGFAVYPSPRDGVLVAAPQDCKFDGVVRYKLEVPLGTRLSAPQATTDIFASITVIADSAEEVSTLLDHADSWIEQETKIEETQE